jgi:DeoR family deoxyribose operon repressor
MNKKAKRHNQLLSLIRAQGMVPIKALAAALQVSEMTVRRDLEILKEQPVSAEILETADIYGILPDLYTNESGDYSLLAAIQKSNEQKARIGEFAASLLSYGNVIIIDTGSTTARMIPYIPTDLDLTIVCFNANVLFELRRKPGVRLYFCGGVYHPNTEMFESPEGIAFIRRLRANKAFISAAGIHETLGVTCANQYEIAMKRAIIESSAEHILLADSGKFGQVRSSYFCEMSDITHIVTDDRLPEAWVSRIEDMDIRLDRC